MTRTFGTAVTAILLSLNAICMHAQSVQEKLATDVNCAAGLHYLRPTTANDDTPAPDGKQPFYINHYGCPAAYYMEKAEAYDAPFLTLTKADSAGALTPLGRDVLHRVGLIRSDAHNRSGELTSKGVSQARELMTRLVERFPAVFTAKGYYSGRSVVENHCIQTMEEQMVQLSHLRQPLLSNITSSYQERGFMNPTDKVLDGERNNMTATVLYAEFFKRNTDDTQLMSALFSDTAYVSACVDASMLSLQLFTLAGSVQMTGNATLPPLFDIFTKDEIYRHWRKQNAWNYVTYGSYKPNGGNQPYMQRATLRNMMHMGDSVLKRYNPMIHIRICPQSVIMGLACLMELDSCGLETADLATLEERGWADYSIAPLGGSIEMIHYRRNRQDTDVLVKVLLNGHEAQLPIATDCAPYYHWNDVKRYYLRRLYKYENTRFTKKIK